MDDLKEKIFLTSDAATSLAENFSGLSYDIFKNHFENQNVKAKGHRWNKFALTLNFYSPQAYNFIKPILSLPDASSISKWTSSVNCDPGLFNGVFSYLGKKIQRWFKL